MQPKIFVTVTVYVVSVTGLTVIDTTYTVTVTNIFGCTDTDDVIVTIYPNPTAYAGEDTSVCQGNSIDLTATGGTFYIWSTTEATATITVTPTITTTYTVTVTDNNGCTASDDVVVFILPAPPADAGTDVDVCEGNSTDLTASGGTSYLWSTTEITATITVSPAITTTYTVTVTDNNGCTASDDVVVNVIPWADATILPPGPLCENNPSVNLIAVNPGGVWSGPGITDASAGTFDPSVAGQGTHTIIYIIPGMCGDSDTTDIIVHPVPNILTDKTDETCAGANNGSVDLTITGTVPFVFNWDNGETTEDISNLEPNTYIVIVTDSNGCSATENIDILHSEILCPDLYVPNIFSPNHDNHNDELFVRGTGIKSLTFIIYDRWGEKIFETTNKDNGWDGTYKGKPLDNAVFIYYLKAEMINNETVERKGTVTLAK